MEKRQVGMSGAPGAGDGAVAAGTDGRRDTTLGTRQSAAVANAGGRIRRARTALARGGTRKGLAQGRDPGVGILARTRAPMLAHRCTLAFLRVLTGKSPLHALALHCHASDCAPRRQVPARTARRTPVATAGARPARTPSTARPPRAGPGQWGGTGGTQMGRSMMRRVSIQHAKSRGRQGNLKGHSGSEGRREAGEHCERGTPVKGFNHTAVSYHHLTLPTI